MNVELTASPALVEAFVEDYRGAATSGAVDVTATGIGSSNATDGIATPSVMTTGPDETAFAYATGPGAAIDGTGWTALTTFDGDLIEQLTLPTAGSVVATAFADAVGGETTAATDDDGGASEEGRYGEGILYDEKRHRSRKRQRQICDG